MTLRQLAIVAAVVAAVLAAALGAARPSADARPTGKAAPLALGAGGSDRARRWAGSIPTSVLTRGSDALVEQQPEDWWGGRYTAATGETVTVYLSNDYPIDPALHARWANYLVSLVHGSEIARVDVYLAPLSLVRDECGRSALACYSPSQEAMLAPGDAVRGGPSPEQIVAHEYGHHVAASRVNPPWRAVDMGTKRWASYVNVCARTRAGSLFPGGQGGQYRLDPGEGFAEAYRALNEIRAGAQSVRWDIVSRVFYPDQTALRLLEQDVLRPWSGPASATIAGRFRAVGTRVRTYSVATPLDGTLRVSLRPASGAFRLSLLARDGGRVLRRGATIAYTICGQRSLRLRVERRRGAGRFSLAVSKP